MYRQYVCKTDIIYLLQIVIPWIRHAWERLRRGREDIVKPPLLIDTKSMKINETSDMSRTLVGNNIVDLSDVVGAAPIISLFST